MHHLSLLYAECLNLNYDLLILIDTLF